MKRLTTVIRAFLLLTGLFLISCNGNKSNTQAEKSVSGNHRFDAMMQKMKIGDDQRIALNPPPMQARHQLINMRNHLVAIQTIIQALSKDDFDKAAEVASAKLGLTDEMKMMCSAFGNEEFEKLGLAFHQSADKMSEVFKTRDKNKSLEALSTTMTFCVTCHSKFKQ